MAKKYLDSNGSAFLIQKIKNLLLGKVDVETGKVLSSNDYTNDEKAKLANIQSGAERNVNADWDAVTGPSAILNKPTIPSKTSDLTNDSHFPSDSSYVHTDNNFTNELKSKLDGIAANANRTEVDSAMSNTSTNPVQNKVIVAAIAAAVGSITGIRFQKVIELPTTGENGVIYLVAHEHGTGDSYDEFIWLSDTSTFEKIGTTDIDLSGYMLKTDMVAITNSEIDDMFVD